MEDIVDIDYSSFNVIKTCDFLLLWSKSNFNRTFTLLIIYSLIKERTPYLEQPIFIRVYSTNSLYQLLM